MAWADEGIIWKSENLRVNTVMERKGVALLEVGPATATNQKGVTGEGKRGRLGHQYMSHSHQCGLELREPPGKGRRTSPCPRAARGCLLGPQTTWR